LEILLYKPKALKKIFFWGGWVAQLVGRLTLDFGSGHDLRVVEIELRFGLYTGCGACLGFSLSLCAPSLSKKFFFF